METEAIFHFIADDPITALIVGGILFLLLGGFFLMVEAGVAVYLTS